MTSSLSGIETQAKTYVDIGKVKNAAYELWMSQHVQLTRCDKHQELLMVDRDATMRTWCKDVSGKPMEFTAKFHPCPKCEDDRKDVELTAWLHERGVPQILCGARFSNWRPSNEAESSFPDVVREFQKVRRGFLYLLGPVGNGKSHLAVAAMADFKKPVFVKQSTLLGWLRKTYRDKQAVDPVELCQNADLLVLEEVGLSSGGRDELPLLHEILDYRHGEFLPTIMTGNLALKEMSPIFGERLVDRMRQSTFKVLVFSGKSVRSEMRENYFSDTTNQHT